ncbi:MAG: CpsD/CapB family tyrosine-protein kinase [Terriglobia bacterium]
MSRIHDALKKAEQDRAAGLHSPAEVGTMVEPTKHPASVPKEENGSELVASLRLPLSTLQGGTPVTLESWVSTCPSALWKPDPHSLLFADPASRQIGVEEFRTLRTHLAQMREKLPLQTILVTSALPSEGKTFIAANLAHVFVQQRGKRALLIDGDLRMSRLHAMLGTARSPGLSDFLRGKADISEIIQRGAPDNLFFIPGGQPVSNPMELIGNGRLKGLLHRLAPLFDWIVIDSPPCVPLSDANVLADLCDGVLMVVLAGKTPFDMAQKGGQQFRDKRLLGVVLNHVAPQASYSAHYYHAADDDPAEHKQ